MNPAPDSPFAPIFSLLTLDAPTLSSMSDDEIAALLPRLKAMTDQPQTLSSILLGESNAVKPPKKDSKSAAAVKSILSLLD